MQNITDKQSIKHTLFTIMISGLLAGYSHASIAQKNTTELPDKAYQQWLKDQFSEQHQQLIPIVAVADIFFGCNKARKTDANSYTINELVTQMNKKTLAEKVSTCLGSDEIQSDNAINFGLLGCFSEQLTDLSHTEKQQKMEIVKSTFSTLSHAERQKSFTQCVNAQAINDLK